MSLLDIDDADTIYHVGGFNDGRVPAFYPLVAVSAIFDDKHGFDHLAGANSIVTLDDEYAIAGGDEGLTVISLADPYHPVQVTSITDISVIDMDLINTAIGPHLVVEADEGVLAFNVSNPASPVQVAVNTGLTDVSFGTELPNAGIVYLSGDSKAVTSYEEGGLRVVRGTSIDAQRIDHLMMVENAADADIIEIGGRVYGLAVTVTANPVSNTPGHGNLLVYDVDDPHGIIKLGTLLDNPSKTLYMQDPRHIETFNAAGTAFAIVSGISYGGDRYVVGVVDVSDPLNPTVESRGDGGSNFRALAGASDFDIMWVDGHMYGLVASPGDDAVQVMDISYLGE